jgi:calcineurin-like phosphoesterase family protein
MVLQNNSWLFTDPHYHHKMLTETGKRPLGFEQLLTESWQSQVQPEDTVFCLGDVCMGDKVKVHDTYIKPMPGRKILIKGNHDKERDSWYLAHGWDEVCEELSLTAEVNGRHSRILLTHIPVPIKNNAFDFNVHGHFHNDSHRANNPKYDFLGPKHRLLALECVEYKMIRFIDFLEGKIEQVGLFQRDAKS